MPDPTSLTDVFDAMDQGVIAFDGDLKILAANDRAAAILDIPEDMIRPGASFETVIRHAAERGEYGVGDAADVIAVHLAFARGQEAHSFDRHQPDGSVVEVRAQPLPGGGFVVAYTDVTERHRAERKIERQNELLAILQKVAAAANLSNSVEEAFGRAIDQICAYAGWPIGHVYQLDPKQDPGQDPDKGDVLVSSDIWHLDSASEFEAFKEVSEHTTFTAGVGLPGQVLASGAPVWVREPDTSPDFPRAKLAEDLGIKAGFAFPVLVGKKVVAVLEFFAVEADAPDGTLLSIMRSVGTQLGRVVERETATASLRNATRQAELANRAKSDFLANMSHELRTPLNAIIGFAELLQTPGAAGLGEDSRRQYIGDIAASGRHLLSLINDLLDLSKIEAEERELREEVFDPGEEIGDCLKLVGERAKREQVTLDRDFEDGLPLLTADVRACKQIALNLVTNAIKFTEPGGRVTVSLRRETDGAVALAVADTGIGMKPSEVEVALQPFRQIDSGLARRHDGTGLGLPLVKGLVELHGGRLEIASEPGKGTTATVRFPAARSVVPGAMAGGAGQTPGAA